MIDPACGSGHFLLGGFERLLREWRRFAPGLPPAEQAQRALDAIAGVDLNPFAVEIARFRLLLAALRAADVRRLAAAPGFVMHLAAGDSLLHGRHFFRHELGGAAEGFRRVLRHHYAAEDTAELDRILGRQYHAVVGNPPYITPKDAAMRDAYREIYASCHRKYGLGAPFTERFFDLALPGTAEHTSWVCRSYRGQQLHEARVRIEADRGGLAAARPDACSGLFRRLYSRPRHANGNSVRAQSRAGAIRGENGSWHSRRAFRARRSSTGFGLVGNRGSGGRSAVDK